SMRRTTPSPTLLPYTTLFRSLPKNSQITGGKTWPKPAGATEVREFKVYRWNPDDGKNPSVDTYYVDVNDCGPMVLDGLIWIKNRSEEHTSELQSRENLVCRLL